MVFLYLIDFIIVFFLAVILVPTTLLAMALCRTKARVFSKAPPPNLPLVKG